MKTKKTKTKATALRLSPDLYNVIEALAKKHLRSVNNEMIYLLEVGLAQLNQVDETQSETADFPVQPA